MRGNTEKIDKIIQGLLTRKGITKNIQLNKIRSVMEKVLTKEEMSHLKLGYLKAGKLYLYVDSSSVLYEIRCFKKQEILNQINNELKVHLKDICLIMDSNRNDEQSE